MEKYKIIRNALDKQSIELLKNSMLIARDAVYFTNNIPIDDLNHFSDGLPNSFPISRAIFTESLLLTLLPLMEQETGKDLYPTYSYSRIYWKGSNMFKHMDREPCEYSASVCISVDPSPWIIWMDGDPLELFSGDLVIYKGLEVEHWRETYTGNEQFQIFLHYVDKYGLYADHKFDKRPLLGINKAQ